jgi:glycosyltransferase involved in cell wall biosynthesis
MYNVAGYLTKCVDSVLKTNLDPKSFEIIFIDDESPDNSKEIANRIIVENAGYNFKLISQRNKGLGGARNTGIDSAVGRYLIFLDPDDLIVEHDMNSIVEEAQSYDLEVMEFNALLINEKGDVINRVGVKNHEDVLSGIHYSNQYYCSGSACNKLYFREFLNRHKLRFMEKVYGEDFEFNTRVFYQTLKVKGCNRVVSAFLQSPNSITRNTDISKKLKYLEDYIKILSNLKMFFSKVPPKTKEAAKYSFSRMSLINTNSFILILKNRIPSKFAIQYRNRLSNNGLLYIQNNILMKNKNLLRKYLFNNKQIFFLIIKINNILRGTVKFPASQS